MCPAVFIVDYNRQFAVDEVVHFVRKGLQDCGQQTALEMTVVKCTCFPQSEIE